MILQIKTYRYEKIETSCREVTIPDTTVYGFETGIRRSFRVVPSLYELDITCVYQCYDIKIEQFMIKISDIENILTNVKDPMYDFCNMLVSKQYSNRTELQFETDLHNTFHQICKKQFDANLKNNK
jgi:hypothetical protein